MDFTELFGLPILPTDDNDGVETVRESQIDSYILNDFTN